jgi:hypothetical protein
MQARFAGIIPPSIINIFLMAMGIECAYSFTDLYQAAFGRLPSREEMVAFGSVNQESRNAQVREWARIAGWETKDKNGSDGRVYTAFAPSFSEPADKSC